jgi:Tfp pilus assembly protein PilF
MPPPTPREPPRSAALPAVAEPRPTPVPVSPPEPPIAAESKPDSARSGAILAQANRALRDGSLVKAVELARQAVNASPGNADAWLTLGAAYQATGDPASARQAYQSCVDKARSANVGECRVLAGH